MRMTYRHNYTLPFFEDIFLAVYRDFANAVETRYESVAARLVLAYFLTFIERKQLTDTALFCASVLLTT